MYIFRWLMKHPIIILALYFLSIVAILFSMTGGDSTDTDTSSVETPEIVKEEVAVADLSKAPKIEPSTLTSALVGDDKTGEDKAEEATADNKEADTAKADATTEPAAKAKSEESVASTDTSEAKTEEAAASTEDTEATATTEAGAAETPAVQAVTATEAPVENQAAESDQFSGMNTDELLLMAREAYWNNGLEESAQIYQQLIAANPDVVDYKGELGNVFWRQGFPKKAAELYAEISLPMIELGKKERVANMVGFIGLHFPEKATEIHNRLQAEK